MRPRAIARLVAAVLVAGVPLAMHGAILRATIDVPEALGAEFGSEPQRSVRLELFLGRREVEAVLVVSTARNPALASWDARDVGSSLKWDGSSLGGVITATVHPVGSGDPVPWKCVIKADWRNGVFTGRAESVTGNSSMSGHVFSAEPVKLAAGRVGGGFVELFLPGDGERPGMRAGLVFRDGKAVASASFSPLIHPVWQRMDASKLVLDRGRLSGRLEWVADVSSSDEPRPPGRTIELHADLRDGFARFDDGESPGAATLLPVPDFPESAQVELAFDAPLVGGEQWRRRTVVRFNMTPTNVSATGFLNGRAGPGWDGVVDAMSIERKGVVFDGTIDATVASATVQPGFYRIRFKGVTVGPWIVGAFESELAGSAAASGNFTGWSAPAGG